MKLGEMTKYMKHINGCEETDVKAPCTCGLAELLRRLNAEPANESRQTTDCIKDFGTYNGHPYVIARQRDAEPGKPRCREDFIRFFAKWWADMDLDKLRESMNDPIWADGKHCGDCTKQPHTCNRCALEDIEKQAADFAQFFPAERHDGWVTSAQDLFRRCILYLTTKPEVDIVHATAEQLVESMKAMLRPLPAPPSAPAGEKEKA